ncbi:extracellular solute-binding protein [Treponema phagedenis]|uniref:extracellular solute-binding protein n=1 Tax=Treponema phagedenis TaxID=162 RepID=UPI0001F640BE|nr:extracellular solute-binding protein [Treponema phagedenis]EFW37251.1 ABC transporter, solute-binding protein [Treponema phagedenis F0421]TYT79290.1 extracellular solute-binding protein [Treponema phagedenis]
MKHTLHTLFTVLGITFLLGACNKTNQPTLYLYNWTYYTPDSVIKKFEDKYGVTVVYDDYASNEDMFAKLMAGGVGYDIVVPSADYVSIMKKTNMLEKIDLSKIPNVKYIKKEVQNRMVYDPNMEYSVPYYMGAAGIAVNKNEVKNYEHSWNIFEHKELHDRMTMMDDMREVLGAALAYRGYDVNTSNEKEVAKAAELVNKNWKPNLIKFDADGFAKSFASGDFLVVHGYAEAIFEEIPDSMYDSVDFFIPQEKGSPLYMDSLCIPKGAKNIELAHQFINFILEPENYAEFLDSFGFPPTIHTEAGKYQKEKPHYTEEDIKHCVLKKDLGEYLEVYNQYWQDIRFKD